METFRCSFLLLIFVVCTKASTEVCNRLLEMISTFLCHVVIFNLKTFGVDLSGNLYVSSR